MPKQTHPEYQYLNLVQDILCVWRLSWSLFPKEIYEIEFLNWKTWGENNDGLVFLKAREKLIFSRALFIVILRK